MGKDILGYVTVGKNDLTSLKNFVKKFAKPLANYSFWVEYFSHQPHYLAYPFFKTITTPEGKKRKTIDHSKKAVIKYIKPYSTNHRYKVITKHFKVSSKFNKSKFVQYIREYATQNPKNTPLKIGNLLSQSALFQIFGYEILTTICGLINYNKVVKIYVHYNTKNWLYDVFRQDEISELDKEDLPVPSNKNFYYKTTYMQGFNNKTTRVNSFITDFFSRVFDLCASLNFASPELQAVCRIEQDELTQNYVDASLFRTKQTSLQVYSETSFIVLDIDKIWLRMLETIREIVSEDASKLNLYLQMTNLTKLSKRITPNEKNLL